MTIGKRIKYLRDKLDLTQEEVAQKLGVASQTIYKYENEIVTNIPLDKLEQLAAVLSVSPAYLMGWETPYSSKGAKIPVLGSIPAGIPIEAIEDIRSYEEIPVEWLDGGKTFFALSIKGDSMLPEYRDGDIVIFKKECTCRNGDDCAFRLNGDEATFKRVEILENGDIILRPLNPEYPATHISLDKEAEEPPIEIIGIACEIRRQSPRKKRL